MSAELNAASEAVFAIWLETGEPVTRVQIVDKIGCSAIGLRKYVKNLFIPGCEWVSVTREQKSRDYPMLHTGKFYRVDAWHPERSLLRARLREIAAPEMTEALAKIVSVILEPARTHAGRIEDIERIARAALAKAARVA